MNLIDLFKICPDIKSVIWSFLDIEIQHLCILVCKDFISDVKMTHSNMSYYAAKIGSISLLGYTKHQWNHYTYTSSVYSYNLSVTEYLHDNGCNYAQIWNIAAECGNLPILQWLSIPDRCIEQIFNTATHNGHVHILEWIHKMNKRIHYNAELAIQNGHLDVLRWMLKNHYEIYHFNIIDAAKYNQFEIVKWLFKQIKNKKLHTNGNVTRYNIREWAQKHNNQPMLEWAVQNSFTK